MFQTVLGIVEVPEIFKVISLVAGCIGLGVGLLYARLYTNYGERWAANWFYVLMGMIVLIIITLFVMS